ncbi:MAG: hypothetical protein JSV89_03235 [Spirochaetaceae bacterium]|nr:MAG: hypothetical protein JSV89_03235 [Spirochaetaceae bacterium]
MENYSGDEEQEYFVDAMTDLLISELHKIGSLHVISRTSSMHYKGTQRQIPEIARELGVEALVEGSVLRDGDQVRFTVRLIRGSTDELLWTDNYDRNVKDLLILQSNVAQAIAHEIRATITPKEETLLGNVRSIDPEVLDLEFQGRYLNRRLTVESLELAVEYFERAIEIDSEYAPVYEGLAEAFMFLGQLKQDPSLFAKSEETILKALEIDDTLPGAHTFLANSKHIAWDFEGAEAEFRTLRRCL